MAEKVKSPPGRRPYDTSRRRAAAQQSRRAIAGAARDLFVERGYAATTMAAIAEAAGVSHETVYASFGPKPAIFRHLFEAALSGTDEPVPPLERDYARRVMTGQDADEIINVYAHAMRLTNERLAPLFEVLHQAARSTPELQEYASELTARRAHYTWLIAEHLAAVGTLRQGVSVQEAADVLFAFNSSEFFLLLARDRAWEPAAFEAWLANAWKRLLLAQPSP